MVDGQSQETSQGSLATDKESILSVRLVRGFLDGELKISHLTLYTFSSENWNRPERLK